MSKYESKIKSKQMTPGDTFHTINNKTAKSVKRRTNMLNNTYSENEQNEVDQYKSNRSGQGFRSVQRSSGKSVRVGENYIDIEEQNRNSLPEIKNGINRLEKKFE